jgi:hypothetical protein
MISALAMGFAVLPFGCEEADISLPSEAQVEAQYASTAGLSVRLSGNIVELIVDQPIRQVRRGGSLWAKVGPYIYLFTDETESLLREYPGVSGVRVITRTDFDKHEVARAFLHREALNELTWRRARNIAGRARTEGTRRPVLLEDLVEWGQEHTEYGYSEEFVS